MPNLEPDSATNEIDGILAAAERFLAQPLPKIAVIYTTAGCDHRLAAEAIATLAPGSCEEEHLEAWARELQRHELRCPASGRRSPLFPDLRPAKVVDQVAASLLCGSVGPHVLLHAESLSPKQWQAIIRLIESKPIRESGAKLILLVGHFPGWLDTNCPQIAARAQAFGPFARPSRRKW